MADKAIKAARSLRLISELSRTITSTNCVGGWREWEERKLNKSLTPPPPPPLPPPSAAIVQNSGGGRFGNESYIIGGGILL